MRISRTRLTGYVCLVVAMLLAVETTAAQRSLSLEDAVQLAISQSPDAAIERTRTEEGDGAYLAARGAFQPTIKLKSLLQRTTLPTSSALEGPGGRLDQHFNSQGIVIQERLPWRGITLEVSLENTRTSTSNPFFALNPYYAPVSTQSLLIPLWRNSQTDSFRTEMLVRKRQQTMSQEQFAAGLLGLSARVEAAYWEWVSAQESVTNAEEVLRIATATLESTQRMVKEGDASDAEGTGATGQQRRAAETLAQARGALQQTENTLKALLSRDAQDDIWQESLKPATPWRNHQFSPDGDPVKTALLQRPELRVAEGSVAVEDQRRKLAQEGLKPRVDLSMGHTSRGLAGREMSSGGIGIPGFDLSPPAFLIGGYGRGFTQLWQNTYPSYQASLEVELPIFQRQARGELGVASASMRRAELQKTQTEIQIGLEVRQALTALAAAKERITEADGAVDSSRLRLESEQRLYREGLSDNLNLNVRQNELAESQRAAVAARRAWHLAAAELRRATAQSFEDFKIRVQ